MTGVRRWRAKRESQSCVADIQNGDRCAAPKGDQKQPRAGLGRPFAAAGTNPFRRAKCPPHHCTALNCAVPARHSHCGRACARCTSLAKCPADLSSVKPRAGPARKVR